MSGIDQSIGIIRQEFEVKLRTLAAEFTDTLEQIHIALEGITKGSRMAFDVVRTEIEDLKKKVTTLEQLSSSSTSLATGRNLDDSTQVILPGTDIVQESTEAREGKEL